MKKFLIVLALLAASVAPAAAQTIGSLPDKSPFLDINDTQRFGIIVGYLFTGTDEVGVGPKSAPMLGVRYDLPVGGPAYITGSIFGMRSTRTVLDYTKSAATRNVGTQSTGMIDANVALGVSLTGERSWRGIQPIWNLGVGFMGGLGDKADVSGYQMQSSFSFSTGFGVRWVTGKNSELRADANLYWWQIKYPEVYRSTQGDPIAIKPNGGLSTWTTNAALSLGWSIRSFR